MGPSGGSSGWSLVWGDVGALSPSSDRVAYFQSVGTGGLFDLKVVDLDGQNDRLLARGTELVSGLYPVTWTADGDSIISVQGMGNIRIYSSLDGGYRTVLSTYTGVSSSGGQARLSPDGRELAFANAASRVNGRTTFAVHVVNRDGTGLKRLTEAEGGASIFWVRWGPEGKWIYYYSTYNGSVGRARGIYRVHYLTGEIQDVFPKWHDDGTGRATVLMGGRVLQTEGSSSFLGLGPMELDLATLAVSKINIGPVGGDFPRLTMASPNGEKYVFARHALESTLTDGIYVANRDGTEERLLRDFKFVTLVPLAWVPAQY